MTPKEDGKMRSKIRVGLSILVGISFPILLLVMGLIAYVIRSPGQRSIGMVFYILIGWPLDIFNSIFPPPAQCPDCGPIGKAVIATAAFDVFMYTALAYFVLWWYGKRKRFH